MSEQTESAAPVHPRVYRCRVKPAELIDCGFYPEMIDPWSFLKRYLKAKKLPEWCLEERTPVRMDVETDGAILLEFEG